MPHLNQLFQERRCFACSNTDTTFSRREISLCTKKKGLPGSGTLYGADERMLEVFDNDSTHRILHIRRRDSVWRRICFTSIPALVGQRRLRVARRPDGELIKDRLACGADELEAN